MTSELEMPNSLASVVEGIVDRIVVGISASQSEKTLPKSWCNF